MIKVNLLPQRKAKRSFSSVVSSRSDGPSTVPLFIGLGALAAAAAAVFLVVDKPKRDRLSEMKDANAQLQVQINEKNKALQGYAELKSAEEESKKRAESIKRLMATKVVPAHLLHELGKVLTREGPTMTETMARLAGTGPDSDPNKRFVADWDPGHVWVTSFAENGVGFTLTGGAQSEQDVTQLSKRMAASVYFMDVTPAGGERIVDRETGTQFYRFTITGRVAY
ncbi:MAG: PilN domain-containing protein [Myxococcales bacterium]|nr:PilN domain-containing protein [Myxococcales bacterium]